MNTHTSYTLNKYYFIFNELLEIEISLSQKIFANQICLPWSVNWSKDARFGFDCVCMCMCIHMLALARACACRACSLHLLHLNAAWMCIVQVYRREFWSNSLVNETHLFACHLTHTRTKTHACYIRIPRDSYHMRQPQQRLNTKCNG